MTKGPQIGFRLPRKLKKLGFILAGTNKDCSKVYNLRLRNLDNRDRGGNGHGFFVLTLRSDGSMILTHYEHFISKVSVYEPAVVMTTDEIAAKVVAALLTGKID